MKINKQLEKPGNWQDFETLCKVLWGEIWNCDEIMKNGRSGQVQHGVDIYGTPKGGLDYFGIQCKGKDHYTHAQLSKAEIDEELSKAKLFSPALKKLYFATTANKDSKIEEYVRLKDTENRSQGLFEVHLFSWEDIADLIMENKRTYEYYVKSFNFHSKINMELSFSNGSNELDAICEKEKHITRYRHKESLKPQIAAFPNSDAFAKLFSAANTLARYAEVQSGYKKLNKSYITFSLLLKNTGSDPINNFKIEIQLVGNLSELRYGKVYDREFLEFGNPPYRIKKQAALHWQIVPNASILVPEDTATFRDLSFKPLDEKGVIEIKWKLLSAEKSDSGSLYIQYSTNYRRKVKEVIIQADQAERDGTQILDYFEKENNE